MPKDENWYPPDFILPKSCCGLVSVKSGARVTGVAGSILAVLALMVNVYLIWVNEIIIAFIFVVTFLWLVSGAFRKDLDHLVVACQYLSSRHFLIEKLIFFFRVLK